MKELACQTRDVATAKIIKVIGTIIIVRHCLGGKFVPDLEDRRALCRIPSKARVNSTEP